MRQPLWRASTLALAFGMFTGVTGAAHPAAERESSSELNAFGTQMFAEGRFQEAEALYRKALKNWTTDIPDAARVRAVAMANLGAVWRTMGRYAEAEPMLLAALKELEGAAGNNRVDVAHTLASLSALYRAQGNLAKAEEFARRASDTVTEKLRTDASLNLASIYIEEHRYDEAEAVLEPALATAHGTAAAVLYNNLATAANAKSNFAGGETMARNALEQAKGSVPRTHPLIATILNTLAQACRFQRKYSEAEENYRQAIEIWEQSLGPSHPDVARGLTNLASFYHERSRDNGAEALYRRAAAIFAKALGEDRVETLVARNELAEVLRAEHRYVESEKLSVATLQPLEHALKPVDPRLRRALSNYAHLLYDTQREVEAEGILQRIR